MRPILNRANPVELNALFIQPTRWCGLNCKGCYVKEHSGGENGFHTPWREQAALFTMFYCGSARYDGWRPWANQITISVDDLHEDYVKKDHMISLISRVVEAVKHAPAAEKLPEVHLTLHTLKTFWQYQNQIPDLVYIIPRLGMLSISEISTESELQMVTLKNLARRTLVNYNHLIPAGVTSLNINRHIQKLTEIGRIVGHIYLVMFKQPVGKERNEFTKIGDKSRMASDITYINTMMERLPEDVRNKISVDGCLQDTIKYTRTGFGCSSNVSRVQVWPDGSVTGCPYAFGGTGPIGRTAEDILENIARARKQYDFKQFCHLPEVYNSIGGRSKNHGTEVQAGR